MLNVTFLADKHTENDLPRIINKATFDRIFYGLPLNNTSHLIILLISVEVALTNTLVNLLFVMSDNSCTISNIVSFASILCRVAEEMEEFISSSSILA